MLKEYLQLIDATLRRFVQSSLMGFVHKATRVLYHGVEW